MELEADDADVAASLGGDASAYRRIVERHQAAIGRRMRRFAMDARTVEELVQDVFVEAYCSLGKFSGRAPFEHWLNRIATHVGYRHLKRRSRERGRQIGEGVLDQQAARETADSSEAAEQLHALLDKLSPRDRLVLTLLHLEDRSVAETAELTGWSRAMVKVQAFRARAKLRKLLEVGT
jgi:RNA polymerase sigma-70 factor (ECF subfamily)